MGAFADAILTGNEQTRFGIADLNRLNEVVLDFETHASDTAGVATLSAQTLFIEANCLALVADEDDFAVTLRKHTTDESVVIVELDAAQTAFAGRVAVVGKLGLLRDTLGGGHHEIHIRVDVLHADHRSDFFTVGQTKEGSNRLALRGARAFWNFVNLLGKTLTLGRKIKDVIVRARGE